MTDYKLVPIDPTPEMVEAAEDAYMPFGDMELAIRMAMLAAPAVQGEPGVKWAPEEVANGNKGIRWVSDEGVHGRPTDHDCRVYLESNPNARGCHCPECTMLYTAPQPAEQQPAPDVAGVGEDADPLPFWEPCNPGCDTEFNGSRSRHCANICDAARTALAAHRNQQEGPPGDPKWSRRIQLDTVIEERDSLRAECVRLVEALERSVAGFDALSDMVSLDAGARNYARQKAIELNGSLATYRQKGGEA